MKFSIAGALVGIGLFASTFIVPTQVIAQQVNAGNSKDLDFSQRPLATSLPAGKTTADTRATAIAGTNEPIYKCDDGTMWI